MNGQLSIGTHLVSASGKTYETVKLLGVGGQGEVYDVLSENQHYALKWYFKKSATARQKKILEIVKQNPNVLQTELAEQSTGYFECLEIKVYLII